MAGLTSIWSRVSGLVRSCVTNLHCIRPSLPDATGNKAWEDDGGVGRSSAVHFRLPLCRVYLFSSLY